YHSMAGHGYFNCSEGLIMFGVFVAAFNYFLSFIFRAVVFKAVVGMVIFFVVALLVDILFSYLPNWLGFADLFDGFPPQMWYFLDLMAFDFGAPLILGAYTTRFLIRRIPFIG